MLFNMPVPEEVVVKPKDPLIAANVDDWPIFSLRSVSVLSQVSKESVSLYSAHKQNPITVIGRLDYDETVEHLSRLLISCMQCEG